jgi:hypothetical protein
VEFSDALAIYAAVVATGSAAWPIYQWRHHRKAHVEVNVTYGLLTMTDGRLPEAVLVTATNTGDRLVRVASVGLDAQDGSGRTVQHVQLVPGAGLPGPIAPHDSAMTYYREESVRDAGLDPRRPVVGWVTLSTGERIKSKPTRLLAD